MINDSKELEIIKTNLNTACAIVDSSDFCNSDIVLDLIWSSLYNTVILVGSKRYVLKNVGVTFCLDCIFLKGETTCTTCHKHFCDLFKKRLTYTKDYLRCDLCKKSQIEKEDRF